MYKDTTERFYNNLNDLETIYKDDWWFFYGQTPTKIKRLEMLIRGAIRRVIRMAKKDPELQNALVKKATIINDMYEKYIGGF